jgi:hypothetical protein
MKARAWLATGMSLISAVLVVVTLVVPDWIEEVFGLDPDAGNGSAEILITLGLVALTVVSGFGTIVAWRTVISQARDGRLAR